MIGGNMSKTAVVVDIRSNAGQDSSMRKENRRKGFTLVLTGACIVSLFGMLGLSVDLGRVYITKSETQSFADTPPLHPAGSRHKQDTACKGCGDRGTDAVIQLRKRIAAVFASLPRQRRDYLQSRGYDGGRLVHSQISRRRDFQEFGSLQRRS